MALYSPVKQPLQSSRMILGTDHDNGPEALFVAPLGNT
jgi:hypothetical protein